MSITKQGAAGFKKSPSDGSYFNAFDNIGECFKLLEDAISSIGINNEEYQSLKIGVSCDSNNWYIEDVHKYEWDGPKNQFDENQLSDFYDKMINDHPLLEYIEDPFSKGDVKAVKKFIEKMQVSHPGVRIGIN